MDSHQGNYITRFEPIVIVPNATWKECPGCGETVISSKLAQQVADLVWAVKDARDPKKNLLRLLKENLEVSVEGGHFDSICGPQIKVTVKFDGEKVATDYCDVPQE
jgi:hypothetical protein